MPVYEYSCRSCKHRFDLLIRGEMTPTCPTCRSADLERLLSLPAVKSDTTRSLAMRAAQKRDAKLGHERTQEQISYELDHD